MSDSDECTKRLRTFLAGDEAEMLGRGRARPTFPATTVLYPVER